MVFSSGWFQPENMHHISKREKITRSKKKREQVKKKKTTVIIYYVCKNRNRKNKTKKGRQKPALKNKNSQKKGVYQFLFFPFSKRAT